MAQIINRSKYSVYFTYTFPLPCYFILWLIEINKLCLLVNIVRERLRLYKFSTFFAIKYFTMFEIIKHTPHFLGLAFLHVLQTFEVFIFAFHFLRENYYRKSHFWNIECPRAVARSILPTVLRVAPLYHSRLWRPIWTHI